MTSCEIVKRAIEFRRPPRLPVWFSSLGINDFCIVPFRYQNRGKFVDGSRVGVDEWGCVWVKSEFENMGRISESPLKDLSDVGKLRFPDLSREERYEDVARAIEDNPDKYICIGVWNTIFERMHYLYGFERTLVDLYLKPKELGRLADGILETRLQVIDYIATHFRDKIHCFMMSDDFGSQQALLMRPEVWRGFFKPRYSVIIEAAHSAGMHTHLHTDGVVTEILPDLVEIGLDIINLQQPRMLGIQKIGKHFSGKICFDTNCDLQTTFVKGTRKEIRSEAQAIVDNWGTLDGGLIINDYGDLHAVGVSLETVRWMYDAFMRCDHYRS